MKRYLFVLRDHPRRQIARRLLGLTISLALVASACTGGDTAAPTTSTTGEPAADDPVGGTSASLIDQAFGTQAVQDFVIHFDLAVLTDSGRVSFLHDVTDKAEAGAGEPVSLQGGFTFRSVNSFEGRVVGGDRQILDHLLVDYGLLEIGAESLDSAGALLAEITLNSESGPPDIGLDGGPALVEIVTAEYESKLDHMGPDDRTELDITFASGVAPGDRLSSMQIFGQTLPGRVEDETGLSGHELFAYRWNRGLISILGGPEGVHLIFDDGLEAVEGSTILSRLGKEALLLAARIRGTHEGVIRFEQLRDGQSAQPEGLGLELVYEGETDSYDLHRTGPARPGEDRVIAADVDLNRLRSIIASTVALTRCTELATELNRRNRSGGIAVGEVSASDTGETTTGSQAGSTTTAPPPTPPEPVSCTPPPDPTGWPKPPVGGTFGDVHMATFDGVNYDNQAAGEFLVFENPTTTVQLRTEPFNRSDAVSMATAVALTTEGQTISIHAGGVTYVDDELIAVDRGQTMMVGGAELLMWSDGWAVAWPDGTLVQVDDFGDNVLLFVTLPTGTATGMLGDADGDPRNDLVTRDGVQLDLFAKGEPETFYPNYIDSWRIIQDESLFHYEPGESTETFTIEGFPFALPNVIDLPADARAEAEAICTEVGVTREELLEACILDVGLTGDTRFAYVAYLVESTTTPAPQPSTGSGDGPTSDNFITVGDLTVELGTEGWVCVTGEGTYLVETSFVDDADDDKYRFTLQYQDADASAFGVEDLTMILYLEGNPVAWMVTRVNPTPGSIDSLILDGSSLAVSGTAFLNDPLDPDLLPSTPLPPGTAFKPFEMSTTCDQ